MSPGAGAGGGVAGAGAAALPLDAGLADPRFRKLAFAPALDELRLFAQIVAAQRSAVGASPSPEPEPTTTLPPCGSSERAPACLPPPSASEAERRLARAAWIVVGCGRVQAAAARAVERQLAASAPAEALAGWRALVAGRASRMRALEAALAEMLGSAASSRYALAAGEPGPAAREEPSPPLSPEPVLGLVQNLTEEEMAALENEWERQRILRQPPGPLPVPGFEADAVFEREVADLVKEADQRFPELRGAMPWSTAPAIAQVPTKASLEEVFRRARQIRRDADATWSKDMEVVEAFRQGRLAPADFLDAQHTIATSAVSLCAQGVIDEQGKADTSCSEIFTKQDAVAAWALRSEAQMAVFSKQVQRSRQVSAALVELSRWRRLPWLAEPAWRDDWFAAVRWWRFRNPELAAGLERWRSRDALYLQARVAADNPYVRTAAAATGYAHNFPDLLWYLSEGNYQGPYTEGIAQSLAKAEAKLAADLKEHQARLEPDRTAIRVLRDQIGQWQNDATIPHGASERALTDLESDLLALAER